jgi:glycosyltransferase involved in cell wall biosynthesis
MNNLISVIMPAYNCENYVRQAIDSILNQTYRNFELLIADDCSKDNTKKIIDAYTDPRIKRFHNEANLGYLKASNKLFKLCKGDFITFQDADDYSDVTRFEKMLNFFSKHPGTDCLGSNIVKVSPTGEAFFQSSYPETFNEIKKKFADYGIVFTGSALMLKKKVIEKVGIYNEYFDRIGSEDVYMLSHILHYFEVCNLPDHLYFYRANPNSVTSTHRNPKALVGHDMIVRFYNNRLNNKPDYIQSGQWKKADDYAAYLLAIRQLDKSPAKAVGMFIKTAFTAPAMLRVFVTEFASKLRYRLINNTTPN